MAGSTLPLSMPLPESSASLQMPISPLLADFAAYLSTCERATDPTEDQKSALVFAARFTDLDATIDRLKADAMAKGPDAMAALYEDEQYIRYCDECEELLEHLLDLDPG